MFPTILGSHGYKNPRMTRPRTRSGMQFVSQTKQAHVAAMEMYSNHFKYLTL